MIKKIQIAGMEFKDKVPEYLIVSAVDSNDEEYCNLAWKCALKQFSIDPDRKPDYKFIVSDYMAH